MKCPKCGTEYSDSVKMCPRCHIYFEDIPETDGGPKTTLSWSNESDTGSHMRFSSPPIRSSTLKMFGWAIFVADIIIGLFLGCVPLMAGEGAFNFTALTVSWSAGVAELLIFLFGAAVLYWLENRN